MWIVLSPLIHSCFSPFGYAALQPYTYPHHVCSHRNDWKGHWRTGGQPSAWSRTITNARTGQLGSVGLSADEPGTDWRIHQLSGYLAAVPHKFLCLLILILAHCHFASRPMKPVSQNLSKSPTVFSASSFNILMLWKADFFFFSLFFLPFLFVSWI